MKEGDFQKNVLIPLFRAMKFRHIKPFDGGVLERGKDIVMWDEGKLKERINYGVVVKVVKVTGKAIGNGSAAEVLSQVKQTLSSKYLDPVTTQEQNIDRCWVVTSKEISKEVIHSIEGELKKLNLDKVVRFIDKDNLNELIQEHLPQLNILERLNQIQKELDKSEKSDFYEVIKNTEKEFHITFNNDETADTDNSKLGFVPVYTNSTYLSHKFTITARIHNPDGNSVNLENIDLEVIQRGTNEIILNNENQNVPWKVTLKVNFLKKTLKFNYKANILNFNVYQALKAATFLQAIQTGGNIELYSIETGLKFHHSSFSFGQVKESFGAWIDILEALVLIQEKVPVLLSVKSETITNEQAQHIFNIAQIVETGKTKFKSEIIKSVVTVEKAKEILNLFADKQPRELFVSFDEQKTNIFGTEINLGRCVISGVFYITENDLLKIRREIKKVRNTDKINIRYTQFDKTDITGFYLKWLSENEVKRFENFFHNTN